MDKHFKGRGLNMDLIKYSVIFDFCNRIKDENINVSIDIGCNLNDNKFKYVLKSFLDYKLETHQLFKIKINCSFF